MLLFNNNAVFRFVYHCFYRLSDVNSFGIFGSSSFKVFVKKNTDGKKIKEELMKINKIFFDKFQLEIEERKLVLKQTLHQGRGIMRNDCGHYSSATLGGFVRKINNKRKIYALTCNHMFPQERLVAYADNFDEIGACVFTTRDKACDFAAIEINDSFSDKCDIAIRRDDMKRVNARLYTESLEKAGLVFKIGARTNLTEGYIISSEYYDKVINLDTNFLVKGLNTSFSEVGDSGSLVLSRPKCAEQTYVDVLGMVYAINLAVYDGSENNDHSLTGVSICYRLHTALELLTEKLGINVQFKDDLSVKSTSSMQSYSSADSLDILQ